MLKNIDPLLSADLLALLDGMGHGDELVLADRNFPAHSVSLHTATRRLIVERGTDTTLMGRAILSVFPLDGFVETALWRMQVVGEPDTVLDVHAALQAEATRAEAKAVAMGSLERHGFYAAARRAYAVVQTGETRPYGCFILKKGVVFV